MSSRLTLQRIQWLRDFDPMALNIIITIKGFGQRKVTSSYLETLYDISGVRIRKIVRYARSIGFPISSCTRGYTLAKYKEDMAETLSYLHSKKIAAMRLERYVLAIIDQLPTKKISQKGKDNG